MKGQDTLNFDLLTLLHDVARMVRVAFDKRARAYGMSRAQWVMLLKLEQSPGLTQKELADLLEVEPMTVARIVDRLQARDMLERRPDLDDRRVWRLHLRPAGRALLTEIARHREELMRHLCDDLSLEAAQTMKAGLSQMKLALLTDTRPETALATEQETV
ncbi:MAG: hypothetical protein B7Z78_08265 [Rhodospirillales bacterium 20-60-12]|nr:MAG: hypothetical protein B7Z78_08265 [Rhodospirillales bacterium 20-60-12]HQT68047.1 MarR family transcriptional regulator [Acetobacteraceae bacterium]